MFARMAKTVGPAGMPMLSNVTDGGKTNNNGRISYTAVLPHRNPLLCTIFAKGALFLWRFLVMRVPFPNLIEPKDIFKRPTLRQGYDEMRGVTYDSSYALMKRLYMAVSAVPTKVLHQGRGECQRCLDDVGVELDQIKRLCKYIHDDQTDSYLLNPPLAALLAAAGYDHETPRAACAAHLAVRVSDSLVQAMIPELAKAQAVVEAEFSTVSSGMEAKGKRLFCARGCGRALHVIFQTFIACSAARARDEHGCIIAKSQPLYKRFYSKNRLFQLPFFSSELFLNFAGQIHAAEEGELIGASPASTTGALSPIASRLEAQLTRKLGPIEAKLDAVFIATQGGIPTPAATAASPANSPKQAEDVASSSGKKKRKTIDNCAAEIQVKRGPTGIPVYVLAPNKKTVSQLWEEYTLGLNGGPAVCDLVRQYGKKWRPPGDASRQLWRWHSYIYEEIERRMAGGEAEADALIAVQERLNAHTKAHREGGRGRHACANWKALVSELQAAHPRGHKQQGAADETDATNSA